VVFAVVAVGVSLMNGLPNLQSVRTYGPQPLRFETVFPAGLAGKLQGSLPVPGLELFAAGPYAGGTKFAIMGVERSVLSASGTNNNGGAYFYTTYFPIQPGPTTRHFAGGFKTVREPVSCGGYEMREVQVNLQTGCPPVSGASSESGSIKPRVSAGLVKSCPDTGSDGTSLEWRRQDRSSNSSSTRSSLSWQSGD
jgi:hypothetical protein